MFPIPPFTDSALTQQRCVGLAQSGNNLLANLVSQFRAEWSAFWDSGMSQSQMQSQLDYLASIAATDPVDATVTNVLQAYFTKAKRLISFVTVENPSAFSDARHDASGQCQEFLTPGWTYTIDQTGRMIAISPCQWRPS